MFSATCQICSLKHSLEPQGAIQVILLMILIGGGQLMRHCKRHTVEVVALLGCYDAYVGVWLPKFRYSLYVPS